MGSNSGSNSGGGNSYNNAQKARKASVPGTKIGFQGTYKSDINPNDDTAAKASLFREQGATNIDNLKVVPPSVAILKGPLKKGSVVNRKNFRENVLGKGAYKGTTQAEFDAMSRAAQESLYSGYMAGRTSGKTDAYGNPISQGGNGGGAIESTGQVVQAPQPVTSPTTAEVSQATAADAQESLVLRKRKTLARGRSPTIMTGVTGATGSLTLGKPSLLGR